MEHINIRSSQIGVEKKENCKFTTLQVLNLLMLFPFFVVKNASRYSNSSLSKLFNCDKDMFYRFMNDGNVKWRKLLYAMNLQLIKKISSSTTVHHDKPVCLIIDDTDCGWISDEEDRQAIDMDYHFGLRSGTSSISWAIFIRAVLWSGLPRMMLTMFVAMSAAAKCQLRLSKRQVIWKTNINKLFSFLKTDLIFLKNYHRVLY